MTIEQRLWIDNISEAAENAGVKFPTMQACEAALESTYGTSGLAKNDNNLFGVKQHQHPIYGTHNLPTKEFVGVDKDTDAIKDGWITVIASWVKYPDLAACFKDRTDTLTRLSKAYPHYAAALAATDAVVFLREVSQTWSTDPKRADKVFAIFKEYLHLGA